ncbi:hypothetical protein F4820DRAFT_467273 [Hypoxylon rubiginosum]|uniref:Uncharacterized protein n=1 Tax=Hypoxylon rubiginosum TaxID=110542 RepID=A0ACB9YIF1_9PEZI|nr:hypothetical protein F4820DRAFT_467273 [Hypoxylon rubiginosum]
MASEEIRSSFGVELEFVIAVQYEPGPPPPQFASSDSRAGPIEFRRGDGAVALENLIRHRLQNTIATALEGHRGDHVINSRDELDNDEIVNSHIEDYMEWEVKRDESVRMASDRRDQLFWHDVEITSPALWATEKSFDEVRAVVNALTSSWWIISPPSSGLHVHYGRGWDHIPFEHLRKIGAFLYAADPILAQMHPENRRNNDYCPSNRLYSNLAHGATPDLARQRYEGLQGNPIDDEAEPVDTDDIVREQAERLERKREEKEREEREREEREKEKRERKEKEKEGKGEEEEEEEEEVEVKYPDLRETRIRAPDFPAVFKRGVLPGYNFSLQDFENCVDFLLLDQPDENLAPGTDREMPLDIPTGMLQILASQSAPIVSGLHENTRWGRSAYNFQAYGVMYRMPAQDKRTIEFRQPAGTLDVDEVLAHIKISVGVADFASRLSYGELYKWAVDTDQAEEHPEWYDVFDILYDMGLVEEARVIQRRHARDRGIEIIDEVAGTFRVPPPEPSNSRKRRFDQIQDFVSSVFTRRRRRDS